MPEPLADQVMYSIKQLEQFYYRLLILVAPAGAGKTSALYEVHKRTGAPVINVNLELCRRMIDFTGRQRILQLPQLLREIVNESGHDIVLLDNMEILFDISLKQDPLRLLQRLSRIKTVIAAWSGFVDNGQIIYATPDHQEYKRYPIRDFLIVSPEVAV